MTFGKRLLIGSLLAAMMPAIGLSAPPPQSRPAQSQPASAATKPTGEDRRRFDDLIALIEGKNSAQARRTGARELLRLGWPEAVPKLAQILATGQREARIAVAAAIAEMPARMNEAFVEPLIAMLASDDAGVRAAASAALAAATPDGVLDRLRKLALDKRRPLIARRAAIQTLGMMSRREAAAALVEVLADRDDPAAAAALEALSQAAGRDFQNDFDAAAAWWQDVRHLDAQQWRDMQLRRLARQNREHRRQLAALERRLAAALHENYIHAPEAKRAALLDGFLRDTSPAVRLLGLELVQSLVAEGRKLSPETVTRMRALLAARQPEVRAAAVRTVAMLRDPADARRFLDMLSRERHASVRVALANGLGYVGDQSAAGPLMKLLHCPDPATAAEAITALGRLAERGVLDATTASAVADALLKRMQATPADQYVVRERLLWAMARVAAPRFCKVFVASLNTPESAAVRLAAVRGIAVMTDPKAVAHMPASSAASKPALGGTLSQSAMLDALIPLTADSDVGVRRAAVETLARYASSDAQLAALWERVAPQREPDEDIRLIAWRSVSRAIAARPVAEIEAWLERLPADEALHDRLAIELLEQAEKLRAGKPGARGALGRIRAREAALLAAAGKIDDAVKMYLTALADLHAGDPEHVAPVAVELLRVTLSAGKYDERIARVLAGGNPALDGAAVWKAIRSEVEQHVKPDEVDRAIMMLSALKAHPPASMPADVQQAIEAMLARARKVRADADVAAVAAAVARLQARPDDAASRGVVMKLGPRAVPALRDLLRAALKADKPDAARVKLLHDLLKAVAPKWPGFAADAPAAEKLKALDALKTP